MKRTTIVLSAAALGGLAATALAGGTQDVPKTGWPLLLGYQPTSLTEAARGMQQASTPRVVLAAGQSCPANELYSNGGPDNANGYSNGTVDAFGFRRTLLDDFEVPNGETWTITDFVHHHVWNLEDPGSGSDLELAIWSDGNGQPDQRIVDAQLTTNYLETAGPDMYFSRQEAVSFSTFDPIVLDAGHYWFEATVVGPENNFWLTAAQVNLECWVNYDDLGGLESGTAQFGSASDINFCLGGSSMIGPTNQFGLKHNAKGDAALAVDSSTLVVSNIGSSGKDGVSVDLGGAAGGWAGNVVTPASGEITVSGVGTQDGTGDIAFGSVSVGPLNAGTLFVMDTTGLSSATYTRTFLFEGAVVSEVSVPSGSPSGQTNDSMPPAEYNVQRTADNVIYGIELSTPVTVGTDTVDEIRFTPDDPTAGIEGLTSACITAANTGDITLDDAALIMFGNQHRRTGAAKLTTVAPAPGPMTPTLDVSNLGDEADGVSIEVDNAESIDVALSPYSVRAGFLEKTTVGATGCIDGTPGSDIGSTFIQNGSNGSIFMSGNFSPISMAQLTFEIYNDGGLVGSVARNNGQFMFLAAVPKLPFPNLIEVSVSKASPALVFLFDGDLDLKTSGSGGSIGIGDEIRVISGAPDNPVTAIDGFTIQSTIGHFVVTGETITGAGIACGGGGGECDPETGDVTGDGCVAFADILVVLGNWEATGDPGIPGDANCDGQVTFADILLILGTWGDGCK